MKIAHIAIATPRRCGLYETTRELVAAERALGIDARIVDPAPIEALYPKGGNDRGVPIADMEWAVTADIVASHSGHAATPIAHTEQPIIHVAHGRPLSTFLGERSGGPPGYSYAVTNGANARYRAVVTFWPEYAPILREMWHGTPVHVVPAPVDLEYWQPGESDYDFAGKRGAYNVVMADPVRGDVSPFYVIHAFALFRRMATGAKLHIYAADQESKSHAIFRMLGDSLGLVQVAWASDLRKVYRAADMLITPHRIFTRSIRESMAVGCQVVSARDADPEEVEAFALEMLYRVDHPEDTRKEALTLFDPEQTARRFVEVVESVMAAT